MAVEQVKEKAVFYKHNGFNCAQAVVKALAEHDASFIESSSVPSDQLVAMTGGFAVGMGTMEATCGALIGANLLAGLKTDGKGTLSKTRQLVDGFKQKSGALICKDLKGVETGTVLCSCDDCIRNAIEVFAKTFDM